MLHDEARGILVDAYERGVPSSVLADVFGVSPRTVRRLAQQRRETGSVALRTRGRGRRPALTAADLAAVDAFVESRPDSTIDEVVEGCGLHVSNETCRRAVLALGWVRKRKSVHASERERPRRRPEEGGLGR